MVTKADLVLAGAGVRGAAYPHALAEFESRGWQWQRIAGVSAGAIIAALRACGYQAWDLQRLVPETDFRQFLDGRIRWTPTLLRYLSPLTHFDIIKHCGFYKGKAFESWLDDLLEGKTFADAAIPLTVVTVDARTREILYLSAETHPEMKISRAVRMSMSIPYFFRWVTWRDGEKDRICVDGGTLDNYPIEHFDVAGEPRWPTIGLYMLERNPGGCDVTNGIEFALSMYSIARDAQLAKLNGHNRYRSIAIDDGGVSWLAFHLNQQQKDRLSRNGEIAARKFLERWNFDAYKSHFRGGGWDNPADVARQRFDPV